jgi:hypothetical protein
MPTETLDQPQQIQAMKRSIPELCELAASGLVEMLDREKQVFCHTYHRTAAGMRRQGVSPRYTMMTLLGLHRYERAGKQSPVVIAPVLEALLQDTGWIEGAGDLGLLLWTCAELIPERLPEVYRNVHAPDALARFSDAQQGRTMEVAWYLTGLASCCLAGYADLPGLKEQTKAARQILESNCGSSGVYGHLASGNPVKRYVRRRIGSFADQVYPTIAFARLAQALNDEDARARALRTASIMCQLQAPLGEWSWHYDSSTGKVVSRYPVFSVHQHAMAPMMLFAAGEAAQCDFNAAIHKGLAWISGDNELHRDFVEPDLGLVWRCIYLRRKDAYADAALRFLQLRHGTADGRLQVRYECRPYELGWLLYAFAGK